MIGDHHSALQQATRLEEAASMASELDRCRVVDSFVRFYKESLVRHMHKEEDLFLAIGGRQEKKDLVRRALAGHLHIRARVRVLQGELAKGRADPARLITLSELLTTQVLFEEREVRPMLSPSY